MTKVTKVLPYTTARLSEIQVQEMETGNDQIRFHYLWPTV